jgi:hypothetical protein
VAASARAIFKGRTVPFDPELADVLGEDVLAALALQQLHYLGLLSPDGWVPMSVRRLGQEIGCGKDAAHAALGALELEGLLDSMPGRGARPTRYRLRYDTVAELLPHREFGPWCLESRRNPDANGRSSDTIVSGIPTQPPVGERDSEAPLSRARKRRNREEEKRGEKKPPPTTDASVAREGGGDGDFSFVDTLLADKYLEPHAEPRADDSSSNDGQGGEWVEFDPAALREAALRGKRAA